MPHSTTANMLYRFAVFGIAIVFSISLPAQELTDKQRSLAGRYAQLEQILLRLAETSATSDTRRATLLNKALLESRDKLLVQRFDTLISALERRQLADAISGQTEIEQDLLDLLKLLESADRNERRDAEKEKIQEFLKDIEEILHSERTLRNQTRQHESQHLPTMEKDQRDIRMRAQTLRDRLAEHEGWTPQNESEPSEPAEPSEQEQPQAEQEQPQEGQSSPQSEPTPVQSEQGQSQDSPPQPQRNQPQQNQPQREQSPSQQALQRALERMRQAEQRLQQAERAGAIEEQEEAIAELQRLKEELERILRQLREEELMQTLEKLEERFKRMLRQEQTIRAQTERLINEFAGETPADQRQINIRADRLGSDQQAVIEDAETVLMILREDGTAQAMVESLLQARFDMTEVKNRLERTALDTVTLHIADAVIDALQEMLEAIQAAIDEARERQENADSQQQSQQQGEGVSEEPLIQLLAELRMIRSMQRRVNERTTRYDLEIKQLLEKPDADLSPLEHAVEELARQQNRISRILHELRIGRTQ